MKVTIDQTTQDPGKCYQATNAGFVSHRASANLPKVPDLRARACIFTREILLIFARAQIEFPLIPIHGNNA